MDVGSTLGYLIEAAAFKNNVEQTVNVLTSSNRWTRGRDPSTTANDENNITRWTPSPSAPPVQHADNITRWKSLGELKKIAPTPLKGSTNPDDAELWIEEMEKAFAAFQVSEQNKIRLSKFAPKLVSSDESKSRSNSICKIRAVCSNGSVPSSASHGAESRAVGDAHRRRSSLESLFCYDKPIPEERIEEPVGLSMAEKIVGDNARCIDCQAKGAVLCTTCSGSGLYVDSIMESQGIIVKVRCLALPYAAS
ncbi:hypothetical protein COLO4_20092 [Corchorus olitorius]|uniref:Uncharacterized protein n=1 Tax=Corchorus olitorius TaxID=93759 RepID=A0A1R3J1P7_9ROSI|nr:hypothetical protein COLO4_20092 [Corchorus olitorius]